MRKLLCALLIVFVSIIAFAQNSNVLKILGIPIDGTESQFVGQLKDKGFVHNSFDDTYSGQFNESDVYVHTNHKLVDRVYVAFLTTNEENIRVEFNCLLA